VGNRDDIEQKYFDLMEAVRTKSKAFQRSPRQEEAEQRQADAIALYAAAAAGYDPQATVNLWDRLSEVHGNTGSWLSDLFGRTLPDSRRLRDMLRDQASRPAICTAPRAVASEEDFRAWQARVLAYTGVGHPESTHGVLLRNVLTPPLPNTLRRIRFSPDGKYLLAQDDASVFVLSRQPFEFLFRIDARDSLPAIFSADSRTVVIYTKALRIETWSITSQERLSVHEITLPEHNRCMQSPQVSDDGKYVACIGSSLNLMVYSVEAGALVFERKHFCSSRIIVEAAMSLVMRGGGSSIPVHLASMHFSPDGKYFVAGAADGGVEAIELEHYSTVPLPGAIKKLLRIDFAFLGTDRLAGVNADKPGDSAVVRFPSGELLNRLLLGEQTLEGVTRGDYLLLTPVKNHAVGIVDIKLNAVIYSSDNTALDVYDGVVAAETGDGNVALYAIDGGKFLASASLPQGPLGALEAFELSGDLSYLALSGSERGAVWDLKASKRLFFVRAFHGGYFADDGSLYADFDKTDTTERSITKMDLQGRRIASVHPVAKGTNWQTGRYLVAIPLNEPGKDTGNYFSTVLIPMNEPENRTSKYFNIEVRETRTDAVLWQRTLHGSIPLSYTDGDTGVMVVGWSFSDPAARDEIRRDPKLAARYGSLTVDDTNYFIEAINAATGKTVGGCVVETGKGAFRLVRVDGTTDRAVLVDTHDRILVYSLSSGAIIGRVFGKELAISPDGALLAIESEPGKASVLDLATLGKREEFSFSSRIAGVKFNSSGTQLLILTTDQTALVLDVSSVASTASSTANASH
jgi:WD40 repeat protein